MTTIKIVARIVRGVWICALLPSVVAAATLDQTLDPIVTRARLKPGTFGLNVVALQTGQTLYAKNADLPLNPASTIKVLITATALVNLGPDYRFETVVSRAGDNLCLIGGGDPSLVNETLWMLVEEVRRAGVKEIAGDLIADSSRFPTTRENVENFEGDLDRAFTAPEAALSANFNSLTIHVDPRGLGQRPIVQLDPDLPVFQIRNRAVTASSGGKGDLAASVTFKNGTGTVDVSGRIGVQQGRLTIYRSVPSPALYAGTIFLEHFRRAEGVLKGHLKEGRCPEGAQELVRFKSKPLSEVLMGLNKFSNNFIAEMLLRAVGREPTPESGLKAVREWLASASIPAPELVLENASGLSKKTRVAARTMTSVLQKVATDFRIGPEFVSSLSILGVDGTLHKWLKESEARGSVRAKSGMLSDVVALSGYAESPVHGRLAFSFLFKTSPQKRASLMQLEQELLSVLVAPLAK